MADAIITVTLDESRAPFRQGYIGFAEGTIAIGAGDYSLSGLSMPTSDLKMNIAWFVLFPSGFVDSNVWYWLEYDAANQVVHIYTIDAPGGGGSCDKTELSAGAMPATPSAVNFRAIGVFEF